jgi:hypothetical protein
LEVGIDQLGFVSAEGLQLFVYLPEAIDFDDTTGLPDGSHC